MCIRDRDEQYLRGLHESLGIEDDFDIWVNSIKDDDEYLGKIHGNSEELLGVKITEDYGSWKTNLFGEVVEEAEGEDAPGIDWNSPELKGEWSLISGDMGQNVWTRKYEKEDKEGNKHEVSEIVPTDDVPYEVLREWEKTSSVVEDVETGHGVGEQLQEQGTWSFLAGGDPLIVENQLMDNIAGFRATSDEKEQIQNNANKESKK